MPGEQSMVERVARAMSMAGEQLGQDYAAFSDHYRTMARVAINAMREPDEAMVRAGYSMVPGSTVAEVRPIAESVWRAMIDVALHHDKEPGTDEAGEAGTTRAG